MKVFVTGSDGFVGSRLVPRLEAAGHEAVILPTDVDICSAAEVTAAVAASTPDAVIHLAALSSVADSFAQPATVFRVNFLGTLNLLRALERHAASARVLLVGSGDVYGSAPPEAAPFHESDPLNPRSPYARSKASAEHLGRLAQRRGLDVVRVRPFNHTGAGQGDTFVSSSFARQIVDIAEGRSEPVMRVGNLASVRDFMDVEDVIDAYLLLLDRDIPASIYNISTGSGTAVQLLLDELVALAGVEVRVETDPERMRPTDRLVGDASRLRDATGWQPRVPLRETLLGLLDSWSQTVDFRKHLRSKQLPPPNFAGSA
jgi:GDP-4-dehydro-6-deoxy-D-mannose reductase